MPVLRVKALCLNSALWIMLPMLAAVALPGCGSNEEHLDELAVVETPPTGAQSLQRIVDEAMHNQSDSGVGAATVFFESAQALREANPGKEKDIAEIQTMFQHLVHEPSTKAVLLPKIQAKLKQLH